MRLYRNHYLIEFSQMIKMNWKKNRFSFNPCASFKSKLDWFDFDPLQVNPNRNVITFTFHPREVYSSFNHLGIKMELTLHMDKPLSYFCWKTKNMILYIGPEPTHRSVIEKQTHQFFGGCYSEPTYILRLFCNFFESFQAM